MGCERAVVGSRKRRVVMLGELEKCSDFASAFWKS